MKTIFTLRALAVFSFVIFFLPFMRTCSDEEIRFSVKEQIEVTKSTPYENNDFLKDEKARKLTEDKKENYTFNFYSLSLVSLDDFRLDNFFDRTFWSFCAFTVILILSILILIFSFREKLKIIYVLSIINLIILFSSTLNLYLIKSIENINQIKIGYYLFVLNSILIVYFSNKLIKQRRLQKE
ncbi:hypothetical protein [Moheibacter sediminis]|uniref:Uncharacterized protein n=1 Tax=Moheibacter sediminis TaxID=1434700 RepID=A0A1W1YI76_9FLAO|nr:hypothetical protein [Moheibacter sediminis]SMC35822.1 hypothetical protein SAMN06296427_101397 [Moheibacter sediminis]